MPDRDQVIYDIERCVCHVPDACRDCSHFGSGDALDCMERLLKDAMELLKEQKAEYIEIVDGDYGKTHWYVCGGCKTPIYPGDRYCHECGRPVKWE